MTQDATPTHRERDGFCTSIRNTWSTCRSIHSYSSVCNESNRMPAIYHPREIDALSKNSCREREKRKRERAREKERKRDFHLLATPPLTDDCRHDRHHPLLLPCGVLLCTVSTLSTRLGEVSDIFFISPHHLPLFTVGTNSKQMSTRERDG